MEPIGKSRFAELNGVRQYLGTKEMADHFNSAAYQFDHDARRKGSGRRLVANEGYRPKDRCDLLWDNYVKRGYAPPKVAVRYTSNHYVGARAVDVGIMTKDGEYDVPTGAEFNEIHDHLAAHGFYWAGQNFGEAWHHEYVGGAPKPVIPGVNQAGDPYYNATPEPPKIIEQEDDDMKVSYAADHKSALILAGASRIILNEKSPTLGEPEKLKWLDQAKLAEKFCRIDQQKAWSGNALNAREHSLLNELLSRFVQFGETR